jgi:hypothetical protein
MQSGLASQSAFVVRYSVCLGDDGGLVPGMTFPLNVPFEIDTIEIHISQVSRAVCHGLIIPTRLHASAMQVQCVCIAFALTQHCPGI